MHSWPFLWWSQNGHSQSLHSTPCSLHRVQSVCPSQSDSCHSTSSSIGRRFYMSLVATAKRFYPFLQFQPTQQLLQYTEFTQNLHRKYTGLTRPNLQLSNCINYSHAWSGFGLRRPNRNGVRRGVIPCPI